MEVRRENFGNIKYYLCTTEEAKQECSKLKQNQDRFLKDIEYKNIIYVSEMRMLSFDADFGDKYTYVTCVVKSGDAYAVVLHGIKCKLRELLFRGYGDGTTFGDILKKLRENIEYNLGVTNYEYYKVIRQMSIGQGIKEFVRIAYEFRSKRRIKEEQQIEAKRLKKEKAEREENEEFKLSLEGRFNPSMNINDFILKVKQPSIERALGNNNKNTFDFITLEMLTPLKFYGDRKKYIKDHIKEIYEIAMNKISNYRYYERYGVPVNYLKLSNLTLSCENILVFKFGIKGKSKEAGYI